MGEVARLFVAVVHRFPVREVEQALAVANKGLEECIHGRPNSRRQVLLMDMETLEALGLGPGMVKENITTRGLGMASLRGGLRLRVGEALLEVAGRCEPCNRMEEIRPGLKRELRGRRGVLCRVVEGGLIRKGDPISVVQGVDGDGLWKSNVGAGEGQ